jgi:hypothetical protein
MKWNVALRKNSRRSWNRVSLSRAAAVVADAVTSS